MASVEMRCGRTGWSRSVDGAVPSSGARPALPGSCFHASPPATGLAGWRRCANRSAALWACLCRARGRAVSLSACLSERPNTKQGSEPQRGAVRGRAPREGKLSLNFYSRTSPPGTRAIFTSLAQNTVKRTEFHSKCHSYPTPVGPVGRKTRCPGPGARVPVFGFLRSRLGQN